MGNSALMYAAINNHQTVIIALIANGARLEAKNKVKSNKIYKYIDIYDRVCMCYSIYVIDIDMLHYVCVIVSYCFVLYCKFDCLHQFILLYHYVIEIIIIILLNS